MCIQFEHSDQQAKALYNYLDTKYLTILAKKN